MSAKAKNIGEQLFGYELVGHLGKGAGSHVYIAGVGGRRCALKHVVVEEKRQERFVDQLEAEHAVGAKVNHPGLRRTLDLKITKSWLGRPTEAILAMELVEGEPLDRLGDTPVVDRLGHFMQTAEALQALHALGYVHCDLKPGNVLVNAAGEVKVIDLGQACRPGTEKERVQGTPDFIAPEQVKCRPVTERTDVFNLGAMMYTLLSAGRKLPTLFTVKKGENSFLLDSHIRPPHEIDERVPEHLSNLVMECVRTDPAKRPADMADLARRLELIRFSMTRRPAEHEFRGSGTHTAVRDGR